MQIFGWTVANYCTLQCLPHAELQLHKCHCVRFASFAVSDTLLLGCDEY